MTSDIGVIKAAQPAAVQTHPTAPTGRPEADVQAKDSPNLARQAEQAEKESEPLEDVVSDLNNLVRELHRELKFSVDQDSGDTVIKIVDRETDEVVRQIPSEEVMHLRKRLQEAVGVFFQDSA